MKAAYLAVAAIVASLSVIGAARADHLEFHNSDGPMSLDVDRNGDVSGSYRQDISPYREGKLLGRADGRGGISGVWLQNEDSDHPCRNMREGYRSWGRFTIDDAWSRRPAAYWGYCDEEPNHDWKAQRR